VQVEKESQSGDFKEIQPYVNGQRGRQLYLNGDVDYGVSGSNWSTTQIEAGTYIFV
jgi:hypothetical protein